MSGIYLSDIFFLSGDDRINPRISMRYIFLTLLFFISLICYSQDVTQNVSGRVLNLMDRQSLKGANVVLTNATITEGTVTDEHGYFVFEKVPVGRYKLQVSFTGFELHTQEVLVIAAKSNRVEVNMVEASTVLSEVTLEENNGADIRAGVTTISIEKTLRIPANFFDPVRMATSYPAVTATNDQANSIIVKGNTPNGLLWRLNGIDIVNPNHLTNAGTLSDKPVSNGGGVNILSAQMLDKTTFYTGVFPLQYGNALSGVFDMSLRSGNNARREYTAQASLLGIDLAAEGPFAKTQSSSYLVNYRYSTVGLLSKMGVDFGDESIDFQDLSFNLNFPGKNGRNLSMFAFGGLSENKFDAKDEGEVEVDKDHYDIDYEGKTYAAGMNYQAKFTQHGNVFFGLGYSSSEYLRDAEYQHISSLDHAEILNDQYSNEKSLLSSNLRLSFKAGARTTVSAGFILNRLNEEVFHWYSYGFAQRFTLGIVQSWIVQPYFGSEFLIGRSSTLDLGLRYVYSSYNGSSALEPRVNFNVAASEATTFNLAYRLSSQLQPTMVYLVNANNKELDFMKSHHAELAVNHQLNSSTSLKGELFYQHLFNVAVSPASSFSAVNFMEITNDFYDDILSPFENKGTGDNYGVTLTAEKSFFQNHYFIAGGSYYESKFEDYAGVRRDTRFAGNYTLSATYGKEWKKDERKRTINLGARALYLGGLRESKIVEGVSSGGEPYYRNDEPYTTKLKDYFRIDLRLSFRKDKPGYTRTFAIDIQNVTANENEAYHYYDSTQDRIVTKYQLGIIPVLVYRIDF
jgi:hypothetical protein